MWKSRWTAWAPVPNKPTVSVDVKQHFNQEEEEEEVEEKEGEECSQQMTWWRNQELSPPCLAAVASAGSYIAAPPSAVASGFGWPGLPSGLPPSPATGPQTGWGETRRTFIRPSCLSVFCLVGFVVHSMSLSDLCVFSSLCQCIFHTVCPGVCIFLQALWCCDMCPCCELKPLA